MPGMLTLRLRRQTLSRDDNGYLRWQATETMEAWPGAKTALVVCDVWDRHWCRGASERLEAMLPRMNDVVASVRERGVLIVHAPSETMGFYRDSPARRRALDAPGADPPDDRPHADPPLPLDASGGGCDTDRNPGEVDEPVWTRQHPAIAIDHDRDVISDDGRDLYNVYRRRGIAHVLVMGVHANMCILNRSFAIKQMVRWGFAVALIRDLTDVMYNPARAPYVSHGAGTALTVAFIEKFWCPTVRSEDLR